MSRADRLELIRRCVNKRRLREFLLADEENLIIRRLENGDARQRIAQDLRIPRSRIEKVRTHYGVRKYVHILPEKREAILLELRVQRFSRAKIARRFRVSRGSVQKLAESIGHHGLTNWKRENGSTVRST
jgi:DNA-directed RNA polymerase specialized sigma24 family protein